MMALEGLRGKIQGDVLLDAESRARYSFAECIYRVAPAGVVLPASREDVLEVLSCARREGVPVTARGSGTAVAGQALGSGIILDFSRYLSRILEFRPEEGWIRVEPGMVLADLNRLLSAHSVRFAPDPASGNVCTLGGMIANNAGGPRSLRYGPTRSNVRSLTVALADGEMFETRSFSREELSARPGGCQEEIARQLVKKVDSRRPALLARTPRVKRLSSGYDLIGSAGGDTIDLARLLVGSEGTLALTLDARLALTPLAKAKATALVWFRD
ncbi:MAG TPA: FAD-binding oxidoreductase, partial [Candidatus Polarisedimenticolia bacterium]|nr:FAD-binding oxidoreductase [Candidatus Polarisedimenticolia bacterium]